jgi:hypothetical protein
MTEIVLRKYVNIPKNLFIGSIITPIRTITPSPKDVYIPKYSATSVYRILRLYVPLSYCTVLLFILHNIVTSYTAAQCTLSKKYNSSNILPNLGTMLGVSLQ